MNESLYPFVNQTTYDRAALVALNQMAEATVRKEKSRRNRFLFFVLGVFGLVAGAYLYQQQQTMIGSILLLYGVVLLLAAISWKSMQLKSSQRQLQKGMMHCTYEFDELEMICNTEAKVERYGYDQVFAVVANDAWFAIFFDPGHGVILDKKGFTQGDELSFRSFIGQHTQLPIQDI